MKVKAVLDHVGIAVADLPASLAFFRDALGLEVEGAEDVASQHVRAHFVPTGESALELLEATAPDSPIARYLAKRGPGLHHITLRVDDIAAALAHLAARGVRLIDERPRPGAEGALVAFIHPASAHGVLVELKEARASFTGGGAPPPPRTDADASPPGSAWPQARASSTAAGLAPQRFVLGNLELISVSAGEFRLDGGAMFGAVPRTLWAKKAPPDSRNRIRLAMRPLLVRGARTMLIDAGVGDKDDAKFADIYGLEAVSSLDASLAAAGVAADDIDIVLATHLHFDHAGGFTVRQRDGTLRPRFPRARYVVRRGEWNDATRPHERNRASYLADNFKPLEEAGVLELVDQDQTIMPGVRVKRTGGHTAHHQMVVIESEGRRAIYVADLLPTTAHLPPAWIMGFDLFPMETLDAKKAFLEESARDRVLVFLAHDPAAAAGYIHLDDKGRARFEPA
jgi:methylmalonyl-CoA epimerase